MKQKYSLALLGLFILIIGLGAAGFFKPATTGTAAPGHLPLPDGAAAAGTFRFAALGDMGTGDEKQLAIARLLEEYQQKRPYDTILMLGDNIYESGDPADIPAKFERPYAGLLKRGVNFYATLGNHDVKKGREAQINYAPFHMGGKAYYSFTRGDDLVEFFAIDSTNFDESQGRWVESALSQSKARWKIAFFHHPLYSSAGKHGSDMKLRARLEPLLVKYGVAAAFSGHDHTYERTTPQQGVQYFVSGAGGKLRRGDLNSKSPFMAAGNDDKHSFMFMELSRDQMKFWSVDITGQVVDSGTVAPRLATQRAANTGN